MKSFYWMKSYMFMYQINSVELTCRLASQSLAASAGYTEISAVYIVQSLRQTCYRVQSIQLCPLSRISVNRLLLLIY